MLPTSHTAWSRSSVFNLNLFSFFLFQYSQLFNFIYNLSFDISFSHRSFSTPFYFYVFILKSFTRHFSYFIFRSHSSSTLFLFMILKALLGDALSTLTEQMGIDMKSELMNPQSMKDVQVCFMLCVHIMYFATSSRSN